MHSNGYLDGDYEAHEGDWSVHLPNDCEFPEKKYPEFTPMVMAYLTELVNKNVEFGCCGGCYSYMLLYVQVIII